MARGVGIQITLPQFKSQWIAAINKYSLGIWNFEVSIGNAAVEVFRDSFSMRRFNSRGGSSWVMRTKRNLRGFTVGSLIESGALRSSIKYKLIRGGVKIYTDPNAFSKSYRHKGFCYAAVHNEPKSAGTRTGRVANMPQRKFMGHSTVLNKKMEDLEVMIFKGLPK